jgi:hypothetical protein
MTKLASFSLQPDKIPHWHNAPLDALVFLQLICLKKMLKTFQQKYQWIDHVMFY